MNPHAISLVPKSKVKNGHQQQQQQQSSNAQKKQNTQNDGEVNNSEQTPTKTKDLTSQKTQIGQQLLLEIERNAATPINEFLGHAQLRWELKNTPGKATSSEDIEMARKAFLTRELSGYLTPRKIDLDSWTFLSTSTSLADSLEKSIKEHNKKTLALLANRNLDKSTALTGGTEEEPSIDMLYKEVGEAVIQHVLQQKQNKAAELVNAWIKKQTKTD